ncbi:MAG: hypothetical protein ACK56I_16460, partial [bacterium]
GDGCPVVVQDLHQASRIDGKLVDEQRVHLRIAVLLDHEHRVVRIDELPDAIGKREGAQAQAVERHASGVELLEGFVHCGCGGAEIQDPEGGRRARSPLDR